MVAPGVADVIEMALLPLFWMVGVATCVISSVATWELTRFGWVAIAFTVVMPATEKGSEYSVLEAEGVPPSVV